MNAKKKKQVIGAGFGIFGALICGSQIGFLATVGVFLLIWGNNIEQNNKEPRT